MSDMKTSQVLNELAKGIDVVLKDLAGERQGFILLCFPLGQSGIFNYISNGQRSDVRKALRELLERWDQNVAEGEAQWKH